MACKHFLLQQLLQEFNITVFQWLQYTLCLDSCLNTCSYKHRRENPPTKCGICKKGKTMSWNRLTSATLICTVINLDSFRHLLSEIWKMNNVYIYMYSCSVLPTYDIGGRKNNLITIFYNSDFFSWNADKKIRHFPQNTQQKMWKCYEKDLSASNSPALSLAHLFNIYYLTVIFNYLCEVE